MAPLTFLAVHVAFLNAQSAFLAVPPFSTVNRGAFFANLTMTIFWRRKLVTGLAEPVPFVGREINGGLVDIREDPNWRGVLLELFVIVVRDGIAEHLEIWQFLEKIFLKKIREDPHYFANASNVGENSPHVVCQ